MSATLVVTNEAFELLWRSQSYCFMTPAAVDNLRKCHARFLSEKPLSGTKCRTMVRKYWRHVPLPQPPEFNHGTNLCLIDLATWPAPPPDAVEVLATDCTMYHLDKDFVLWTVHPADQPEVMVHSIRVLEIARLIQWMKPCPGPHQHPKSRTLLVVDGSDMSVLATYPPGIMDQELPLGSSVFELVDAKDRKSFAEHPPTTLYLPNVKDHGKSKRTFKAVPITLLDGYVFVMEEADEVDPRIAAAESIVRLASVHSGGFQHLSALIREASEAEPTVPHHSVANQGSGPGPDSSPSAEPQVDAQQQPQGSGSEVSPSIQAVPPPALHPQWSSHPPTPTIPAPSFSSKSTFILPSWQLPPLPKYRKPQYLPGVPTPASTDPSTRSTMPSAGAPPSIASTGHSSLSRVRALLRDHPLQLLTSPGEGASGVIVPGQVHQTPQSAAHDARSEDMSVAPLSSASARREGGHLHSSSQKYPPLLSPVSSRSSVRFDPLGSTSSFPAQHSTDSALAASEGSWYREAQLQHPVPSAMYRVRDSNLTGGQHPYERPSSYPPGYQQQQSEPDHNAAGRPREVYFEPPVDPTPQPYPQFARPSAAHLPPYGQYMRSASSIPQSGGSVTRAPYPSFAGRPPLPLSHRTLAPPALPGTVPDDYCRFGPHYPDEYYGVPQQQQYHQHPTAYAPKPSHAHHAAAPVYSSPHLSYAPPLHGYSYPASHPPVHVSAFPYPPRDSHRHHDNFSSQGPPSLCSPGAWQPQYVNSADMDPYSHYGGPPPPPPAPRAHCPQLPFESVPPICPLQHEPEDSVNGPEAEMHEPGYAMYNDHSYCYGPNLVGSQQPQPNVQDWPDPDHHRTLVERVTHEHGRSSCGALAPNDHVDCNDPQYASYFEQQYLTQERDQEQHPDVGHSVDDDEDAPILDLGAVSRTGISTLAGRHGSKSSRIGQRRPGKRTRGVSPTSASVSVNISDGQGQPQSGPLSSKFVAGCVNPRYLMRPSPHGVPCARCGMLESPEWRRGETGLRDLCNACGLKYYREKKQREKLARRAAPTSVTVP